MYRGCFQVINAGYCFFAVSWLLDPNGERIWESKEEIKKTSVIEAEYIAVKPMLAEAVQRGIKELEVFGSNRTVINQLSEEWKVKQPALVGHYKEIKKNIDQFNVINFQILKGKIGNDPIKESVQPVSEAVNEMISFGGKVTGLDDGLTIITFD